MINRENLSKSLVCKRNILEGEIIGESDITVVSPGRGLSPLNYHLLVGATAKRSIKAGAFFEEFDVIEPVVQLKTDYKIAGNWASRTISRLFAFSSLLNAKMWEFHVSYRIWSLMHQSSYFQI